MANRAFLGTAGEERARTLAVARNLVLITLEAGTSGSDETDRSEGIEHVSSWSVSDVEGSDKYSFGPCNEEKAVSS